MESASPGGSDQIIVITYEGPIESITNPHVLMALDSTIGKTTGPYNLGNGTCSFIRILERKTEEWARISSILVSDAGEIPETAEARTDSVLQLIKDGLPFRSAAILYSLAGDVSRNFGDLGWLALSSQMPEYSKAIRTHRKGDIYKVQVKEYGWYVVMIAEEARTGPGISYVKGVGPLPH
jgi:hypothetical protein